MTAKSGDDLKHKFRAFPKAKRYWLFPLILVLVAAATVSAVLYFGRTPQAAPPVASSEAAPTEAVTEAEPATEAPTEAVTYASHAAYLHGYEFFFSPDRPLSRAEAAILLYRLFGGDENAPVSYADVPEDSDLYPEISSVGACIPTLLEGFFMPDEPILREHLLAALCSAAGVELPNKLADADAPYTVFARQSGFCYADETSEYVTRGEAAHIFNRVLGRSPDRRTLLQDAPTVFVDVSPACPYYTDIMEAAVSHEYPENELLEQWSSTEYEKPEAGLHRQSGIAYYLWDDGTLLTEPGLQEIPYGTVLVADESGRIYADNRPHWTPDGVVFCRRSGTILKGGSWNGSVFDEDGYYTSGSDELDGYVQAVYDECTTEDMTQLEKLRACFDYVRDFRYLGRNSPLSDAVKTMPADLAQTYALKIFETGKGDCYNFTAAFLFLARGLGYDAEAIVGYCGYSWSRSAIAHGWVLITMDDGTVCLFDPQIENYNVRAGISNAYFGAFMKSPDGTIANYYPN